MSQKTITLHVPDELYDALQETAEASQRPLETVMLESLDVLFRRPVGGNIDALLGELRGYSDAQLWAVVYRQIPWTDALRLRDLAGRNKQGLLSDTEPKELERLVETVDRYTLLRSEALLLLKQRGQDIHTYLKSGN